MDKIKISVIVPVYNSAKYLERCLKSIVNQTLKEIEIIIVNDGSTDNSLSIIEKFLDDKRIKLINKENEGVSKARNTALNITGGGYIIFVDSDDYVEQYYFEDMYNYAEKMKLDMVISDINFVFLNDEEKNYTLKDLDLKDGEVISNVKYVETFFESNFHGYMCNKLIKKEFFKEERFDENIILLEDVELLMRLVSKMDRIGKINKGYYNYMQYMQHKKYSSEEKIDKSIISINKCFENCNKLYENNKKIKRNIKCNYIGSIFPFVIMKLENFELKEKFLKDLKKIKIIELLKNKTLKYYRKKVLIGLIFLKIFPLSINLKLEIIKKAYKG